MARTESPLLSFCVGAESQSLSAGAARRREGVRGVSHRRRVRRQSIRAVRSHASVFLPRGRCLACFMLSPWWPGWKARTASRASFLRGRGWEEGQRGFKGRDATWGRFSREDTEALHSPE